MLNALLLLLSMMLARYMPFELVLFAYALLGPAHYLTQISWMHDRRYGCAQPGLLLPQLSLITLLMIVLPGFSGYWLVTAMLICLWHVLPVSRRQRLIAMGGALLVAVVAWKNGLFLLIALAVPTVIHIYLFTALFMLAGAVRSQRAAAWVTLGLLLAAGASFFLVPPESTHALSAYVVSSSALFTDLATEMIRIHGYEQSTQLLQAVMGFLAFAYTYHYLNWFSKVEIIGWHRLPRRRAVPLVLLYVACIATYAFSYLLGLAVLIVLSYLHVLLEFPLNFRTIGFLIGVLKSRATAS